MEAHKTPKRWTYEEYARLPNGGATRYEVIAGEVAVTSSPSLWHQAVVGNVFLGLEPLVRAHDLGRTFTGPLDVLFDEGDYFQPDVLFVRKDRLSILSPRGLEAAPDLVIEVLSPLTRKRDRGIKLERYRFYGVREYWIVDPDVKRVEVWHLERGADSPLALSAGDQIHWQPAPGGGEFDIPVADIFHGVL